MEEAMTRDSWTRRRSRVAALAALSLAVAAGAALAVANAGAAPTAKKPSIVWLEQGAGNPYWEAQHKAAAEAGRRLGFTFKAVSGNLNPQDQANIMHQLVDQKPTVIMLNAIDPKAMGPALLYAQQKGVKVLNMYGVEPKATASVTFDEIRTGRVAAKVTLGLLKQRYGSAKGQVAVLSGILGQPASDLRAKGFTDYMKTQSGVKVDAVQPTNWAADKASAAMQDFLVKYPSLAFVYTLSDTLALPAANIADRQGKLCTQQKNWKQNSSCVGFVSADGIFTDQVKSGKFFATQLYSPEWSGYLYAQLAYDLAAGKAVPKVTSINAFLVTPKNAVCALKMVNDMKAHMRTFPFGPSLQVIAKTKYNCPVLDAGM
jgi:ribose transport system substrate-binding protein